MRLAIRKSFKDDISFLVKLENSSFPHYQKTSRQNIRHGIQSDFQEVLIAETKDKRKQPIGALVLFKYSKSLRLYSIALLPEQQNKGYGHDLMQYVFDFAKQHHYERILLEVSSKNNKVIDWYKSKGFNASGIIPDYYAKGEDALKMECRIERY